MNYRLRIASEAELDQLHAASLKILAETGIKFMHEDALKVFRDNGFKVEDDIVYITEEQVNAALATCRQSFDFEALDPARKVVVGEDFVHAQPNAGAPNVHDSVGGHRSATLEDYTNMVKICQKLDPIGFNGSLPVDPSDVSHKHKHMYMVREALKYTDKPVLGLAMDGKGANQQIDLVNIAIGEERSVEDGHWIGVVVNPHSPLAWEPEGLETIMAFVQRNQPVFLAPAIMAGIAGPIDLAGTSVVQNTEILSGIVFTQLIRPGAAVVYSTASTVVDMRRASFCAGSSETMLINMPCLQLARDRYKLPARTMCGLTESSEIDAQAGFESMMSMMFGFMSGANILVQILGTLDALMSTSYEKVIIDAENFSRMQRYQQGPNFTAVDSSVELIRKVGHKADYLTQPDTFAKFRSMWAPMVSVWGKNGDDDTVVKRAREKYLQILADFTEPLLDSNTVAMLDAYIEKAISE